MLKVGAMYFRGGDILKGGVVFEGGSEYCGRDPINRGAR